MLIVYGILFCILILILLLGPRVETDITIKPLHLPKNLVNYLEQSESLIDDLVPGAEKTIIWADKPGVKTPLSVIYLHGFSATRQETAPLSDIVAKDLGANLFYTRFTGHGCSNEAMRDCTINAWVNDIHEAIEIGRRIGEKVVVIGLSTGGSAASWLAMQPEAECVEAFILLSPNFELADRRSFALTLPWGKHITDFVIGPEYSWEPCNPLHKKYWTYRFPAHSLLPMARFVEVTKSLPLESITQPVLVIYSPDDEVVTPKAIVETYKRIGSHKKKLIAYSGSQAPRNHILAGDILSPGSTREVADMILDFVKG